MANPISPIHKKLPEKPTISHIVTLGDSLSDRGTLWRRKLLGFIRMRQLGGLEGLSPQGSFTNGYVWDDAIGAELSADFFIKKLIARGLTQEEIIDGISDENSALHKEYQAEFNLDDDERVKYEKNDFIRNYNEGGLTSHGYAGVPSNSITRFFSRLILGTLADKRKQLLQDDAQKERSRAYKSQTLVVEWSGANDLITVNKKPSGVAAYLAVDERIKNVEELIKHGYKHFVLFNLPDLSLTPRYQAKSNAEKKNAHDWSNYFNDELAKGVLELQKKYPNASIDVFDVNTIFTEAYKNPEKYKFDKDKLTKPFTTSADFHKVKEGHPSPSEGYMFWDDVHPTADMHALLGAKFHEKYNTKYNFYEPLTKEEEIKVEPKIEKSASILCQEFMGRYKAKLAYDKRQIFGFFRTSNLYSFIEGIDDSNAKLAKIIEHALYDGGSRSRKVMLELQWIDIHGRLNLNIPALKEAMETAKETVRDDRKNFHPEWSKF